MKIFCEKHGCHFPEEFSSTLKCPFWKDMGIEGLPKQYKKKVWEYLFAFPADEVYLKTGYIIGSYLRGTKVEKKPKENKNFFVNLDSKYESMSEKRKKAFQKEYFKKVNKLQNLIKKKLVIYFECPHCKGSAFELKKMPKAGDVLRARDVIHKGKVASGQDVSCQNCKKGIALRFIKIKNIKTKYE